jgi:hypothetical protein
MAACPTSQANAGHRPKQDATDFEERERVSRALILLCGRAAEEVVIGSASTGDFKVLAPKTTNLGVRSSNLFGRASNIKTPYLFGLTR